MLHDGKEVRLAGRHFLVNIALPENSPAGLFMVNRDPRKQPKKPDVYVGVVEEIGSACFLVKVGDKVSFKRWEWQQENVDDERLIARETDLVVLNNEVPAPGMIVVKLIMPPIKTSLVLPDGTRPPMPPSFKGEVIAFSPWSLGPLKGLIEIGKILCFQKSRDDQWKFPDGRMILKVSRYYEILAIGDKCEVCQDMCLQHAEKTVEFNVV